MTVLTLIAQKGKIPSNVSPSELKALLGECMDRLTPTQKLALQMRFYEELEIAQIAYVLKMSWDKTDRLLESTFRELRLQIEKKLTAPVIAATAA
jgi:DNA-directed RNA polymerase specialized sigma24 family protein